MPRPASPSWAVICFHTSGSYGSPEVISCRREVSGLRSATNLRTESASACSSSVSISAICIPLLLALRAHAQLVERSGPVDTRVLGQAEHALADDVPLDLAGPAGNRVARRGDDRRRHCLQLLRIESGELVTEYVGGDIASESPEVGPGQLGYRAARTRQPASLRLLAQQQRERLHRPASGVQFGQLAPHALVARPAQARGQIA